MALDIGDVSSLLPPDDSAYGFDTIADFLGVSQVLLERYLSAAGRISALAVGDVGVVPGSDTYTARQDLSQDKHLEGCRSAPSAASWPITCFPSMATMSCRPRSIAPTWIRRAASSTQHQLEMAVDGERVFLQTIGGTPPGNPGGNDEAATGRGRLLSRSDAIDAALQVRVHVKAGPRAVTAAFLQRSRRRTRGKLQPYRSSFDTYDSTGVPAHRNACRQRPVQRGRLRRHAEPRAGVHVPSDRARAQEEPCARQILTTFVRRAYRQPAVSR